MSADLTWTCAAHDVTTTGDCPKCDAENIAALEEIHQPTCTTCRRVLNTGEDAWADDWIVAHPDGDRMETRYTCDGCAAVNV